MKPIDLKSHLISLFEAHEIPFDTDEEWLLPNGHLPAVRASWYQKQNNGVFEVELLLEDGRIINECLAGEGIGEAGILSGLENFCVNSFHVLASAFWHKHYPDQVTLESWTINNVKYNAYISNFGTRASDGEKPHIPKGLFDSIKNVIKENGFESDISWFRFFFANVYGEFVYESLKENEIWDSGMAMLKSQPWSNLDAYYSIRNFIVLKSV